jgi:hypothetical protein
MKRFLRLTQEAAFGTYASGGTVIWPRLSSSGAFKVMQQPEFWTVMDGSGLGVQALAGTNTMALAGSLTTEITATQAPFLLGWVFQRINTAQTSPWPTAELPNDLASVTADYARTNFEATIRRKRYLGVKSNSCSLQCSKESPKLMGTFGLVGSTPQGNAYDSSSDPTSGVFAEPALTVFPSDVYLFQHLSGNVTIGGAARTNFDSFSLTLTNKCKAYFDEGHFANAIRMGGRSLTVQLRMRLKGTPDDWAAYEQGTATAASFTFNNGTHTIALDMKSKCYINPIDEESPIDEEHYASVTLVNQLDAAAGTDFAISFT